MSGAKDSDVREVIRRRIALRERDGHERLLLSHIDLRALLDAADERDRLTEAVERIEELATNAGYLIDGFDGLQVGAVLADDILRVLDGADQ